MKPINPHKITRVIKTNRFVLLLSLLFIAGLGIAGCEGPMGPAGPQGEQGPPGPVGPAGSDGSIIHAGEGAPDEETGTTGDFYLDLTTGNLFGPKMTEGWGVPTNLQGPEGQQGDEGPQGPQGPAGEDGENGQDGQDGEDGQDGKDGDDGQDGEDGEDGQDGSQIYAGNGTPDNNQGQEGDYYLDKTSYDLYGPKTGSGWGTPVNLQGPKGDQGPAGTTNHSALNNLGADDHLQYLLADGVRDVTDGFAISGTFGNGVIPFEGTDSWFMWYPGKASFRAGYTTGNAWDDVSIGNYSVAMGYDTRATGNVTTALGSGTTASGSASVAMGFGTTASGNQSMAMGSETTASNVATTALGYGTTAATVASLSVGLYNDTNTSSDNSLFVAGNGIDDFSRSDALVLDKNGDLWIAGTLTQASDLRLKTDLTPLEVNVLSKLNNITPVRYRFKKGMGHPENEQLGLIAQEVQAHFPELVNEKNDGSLGLSYSKLSTVLLKGVQEQQEQIERLETRLARLEQQQGIHAGIIPFNPWKTGGIVLLFGSILMFTLFKINTHDNTDKA